MNAVHCLFDQMVSVTDLKPHPKNRNKHPVEQLRRLAEILNYQGWRYPIKVSKLSGFITSGHGRLAAAKILGLKHVPVNYQDYESLEQEYADLTADNAISLWAEIDFAAINADLGDFGPELNIDMLGLKDFTIEPLDKLQDDIKDSADVGINFKNSLQVDLKSEDETGELYEELRARGFTVKVLSL